MTEITIKMGRKGYDESSNQKTLLKERSRFSLQGRTRFDRDIICFFSVKHSTDMYCKYILHKNNLKQLPMIVLLRNIYNSNRHMVQ